MKTPQKTDIEEVKKKSADSDSENENSAFSSDSDSSYQSNSGSDNEENKESRADYLRRHILKRINSGDVDRLSNILGSKRFKENQNILNEPFTDPINKQETTILIEAIKRGNYENVNNLIQHGASCDLATENNSPLLASLTANPINLSILSTIFLSSKNIKNSINEPVLGKARPLHYAIQNKQKDVYQYLLDQGANVSLPAMDKTFKAIANTTNSGPEISAVLTNEPMCFKAVYSQFDVPNENYINSYDKNGLPLIFYQIEQGIKESQMLAIGDFAIYPKEEVLDDVNTIYTRCLNIHNFSAAHYLAKYRSNEISVFDSVNGPSEPYLNALELFAVEGSEQSRDFIKTYGNIRGENSEELLEKFINFANQKYVLNLSYSIFDNGVMKSDVIKTVRAIKQVVTNSERNFSNINKEDILNILTMIDNNGQIYDIISEDKNKKVMVKNSNQYGHAAYFIYEQDSETKTIKLHYCDGNSLDNKNNYIYGVTTLRANPDNTDIKELSKKVSEIVDDKLFSNPEYLLNSIKEFFVCHDQYLDFETSIPVKEQRRGNCDIKSLDIALRKILSILYPNLTFDLNYNQAGEQYLSGTGYDIYKEYKQIITTYPIENFENIVGSGRTKNEAMDKLIYESATESLIMVFVKHIAKGKYEDAIELLELFNNIDDIVNIVEYGEFKGGNIVTDFINEADYYKIEENGRVISYIVTPAASELVDKLKLYIEENLIPSSEVKTDGRELNFHKMFASPINSHGKI